MKQYTVKVPNSKAIFFEELCKQLSIDCEESTTNDKELINSKKKALDMNGLQRALSAIEDRRKSL